MVRGVQHQRCWCTRMRVAAAGGRMRERENGSSLILLLPGSCSGGGRGGVRARTRPTIDQDFKVRQTRARGQGAPCGSESVNRRFGCVCPLLEVVLRRGLLSDAGDGLRKSRTVGLFAPTPMIMTWSPRDGSMPRAILLDAVDRSQHLLHRSPRPEVRIVVLPADVSGAIACGEAASVAGAATALGSVLGAAAPEWEIAAAEGEPHRARVCPGGVERGRVVAAVVLPGLSLHREPR